MIDVKSAWPNEFDFEISPEDPGHPWNCNRSVGFLEPVVIPITWPKGVGVAMPILKKQKDARFSVLKQYRQVVK